VPSHSFTVRPWIMPPLPSASSPCLAARDFSTSTIRIVDTSTSPSASGAQDSVPFEPAPHPTLKDATLDSPWRKHKPSLSFRSRYAASPRTPPTRPRGKTIPATASSDDDAESVLSFTPSVGSKQLATWFSGLLGR
jgi:hypothetical protein